MPTPQIDSNTRTTFEDSLHDYDVWFTRRAPQLGSTKSLVIKTIIQQLNAQRNANQAFNPIYAQILNTVDLELIFFLQHASDLLTASWDSNPEIFSGDPLLVREEFEKYLSGAKSEKRSETENLIAIGCMLTSAVAVVSAGAVVIGAGGWLIAYNYSDTLTDYRIAAALKEKLRVRNGVAADIPPRLDAPSQYRIGDTFEKVNDGFSFIQSGFRSIFFGRAESNNDSVTPVIAATPSPNR